MRTDDAARFREVFDGNFRALLGYAIRRAESVDDAADVVADTFLVAWRRIGEVPPGDAARLWLYGVARRVLANRRRGDIRRERLGEKLRLELVSAVPDPAETSDSGVVVRAAMARLNDSDRELLMLTGWDGLEPAEAATVLGLPARTVRTRLHRARKRLRNLLGDAFDCHEHQDDPTTRDEK
ncbi:RNA polymerase sigma factor [Kribbella solani]|uniref:RNA polymerase sigma factor n=1 Tax=Kribbella solani TaxID=236067 RepID=UPI0029AD3738|nr:RNA polymerase sigma factor [Kribbella solani]MDX2973272.1 RNA polymerase sigma factor [Kribbella solani]MDX3006231.1 RNA polymerase sigma factor [Kribbella solani]